MVQDEGMKQATSAISGNQFLRVCTYRICIEDIETCPVRVIC